MTSMLKRAAALLIVATLTAACTKGAPTQNAEPAPAPPAPVVQREKGADLFPAADLRLTYTVTDKDKPPVQVDEDWLREGDRIVATYNGTPYVTWLLRSDGVWRADPGGSRVLLRYLPPELEDGLIWKQNDVLFKLNQESSQWVLQVLNRSELTIFRFVSNTGPMRVESVHYEKPALSFTKQVTISAQGKVDPAVRTKHLQNLPAPSLQPAPVTAATADEFAAALAKVQAINAAP